MADKLEITITPPADSPLPSEGISLDFLDSSIERRGRKINPVSAENKKMALFVLAMREFPEIALKVDNKNGRDIYSIVCRIREKKEVNLTPEGLRTLMREKYWWFLRRCGINYPSSLGRKKSEGRFTCPMGYKEIFCKKRTKKCPVNLKCFKDFNDSLRRERAKKKQRIKKQAIKRKLSLTSLHPMALLDYSQENKAPDGVDKKVLLSKHRIHPRFREYKGKKNNSFCPGCRNCLKEKYEPDPTLIEILGWSDDDYSKYMAEIRKYYALSKIVDVTEDEDIDDEI